jgi:hypothetical protein
MISDRRRVSRMCFWATVFLNLKSRIYYFWNKKMLSCTSNVSNLMFSIKLYSMNYWDTDAENYSKKLKMDLTSIKLKPLTLSLNNPSHPSIKKMKPGSQFSKVSANHTKNVELIQLLFISLALKKAMKFSNLNISLFGKKYANLSS